MASMLAACSPIINAKKGVNQKSTSVKSQDNNNENESNDNNNGDDGQNILTLNKTQLSPNSLNLYWDFPMNFDFNNYSLILKRNGVNLSLIINTTSFLDQNLVEGNHTYAIYKRANDGSSEELFSNQVNLIVENQDNTAPTIPQNFTGEALSHHQIRLTWSASTDDNNVQGYRVRRNGVLVQQTSSTQFVDTNLTSDTLYRYTVSSFDDAGNESAQSAIIEVRTDVEQDTTAPTQPSNVAVAGVTLNEATISWQSSSDNFGVTGYNLYLNGAKQDLGLSLQHSLADLAHSTTYQVQVSAYDAAGNESQLSNLVSFTTQTPDDSIAPSVPENLFASSVTSNSIALGWNPSTDDSGIAGYKVYLSGQLLETVSLNNFSHIGLAVGGTYTYTVSAFDIYNNESAQSTPLTVTTFAPSGAPDPNFSEDGIMTPNFPQQVLPSENIVGDTTPVYFSDNSLAFVSTMKNTSGEMNFYITKISAEGVLDANFNDGQRLMLPIEDVFAIEKAANDYIYVFGKDNSSLQYLVKIIVIKPNGSIDTNFGTQGVITQLTNGEPRNAFILPGDQGIYINSYDNSLGEHSIIKLNMGAVKINNFGINGELKFIGNYKGLGVKANGEIFYSEHISTSSTTSYTNRIKVIDPQGNISTVSSLNTQDLNISFFHGWRSKDGGFYYSWYDRHLEKLFIRKFNENNEYVYSFANNGKLELNPGTPPELGDHLFMNETEDRVYIMEHENNSPITNYALKRYNLAGTNDPSFASGGYLMSYGPSPSDFQIGFSGIVKDGKITLVNFVTDSSTSNGAIYIKRHYE